MPNIAQNPFTNTRLNKMESEEVGMAYLRRIRRFGEAVDSGLHSCFNKNTGQEMEEFS